MNNSIQLTSWFIIIISGLLLLACNKPKGYKTESGLIFYVYGNNDTDSTARVGSVIKLNVKKYLNDSLVETTYHGLPKYEQVMPGLFYPYEAGEIYPLFHKGDSVVLIQQADSLLKRRLFYQVPSYVTPGDKIVTHFKVLEIFPNDSLANIDMNQEYPRAMERNRRNGPNRVKAWLEENNIDAELSSDTVFIEMITEGEGAQVDAGDVISIRFTAKTMSGAVFGTNMEDDDVPMDYEVGSEFMPRGIDESLTQLQVGDHVRLYLPAMKAFGPSPPPGMDDGFQDMIFEVEVLNKKTPE